MKALLYSLTALAFSSATSLALATEQQTSRDILVKSNEFRYDAPYHSDVNTVTSASRGSVGAVIKSGTPSNLGSDRSSEREQRYFGKVKNAAESTTVLNNEFWIYESWITLENDIDYDGYHSTFSIEFDADTIFNQVPVYAVLYLGANGAYDAIHVSSEFYIYGEDSTDTFTIESTLVSGFPPNEYDILLELYDAETEELVAFTDGYDDGALAFVPLESENNEYTVEETVVIVEEHGGTWSAVSLFCLVLVAIGKKLKPLISKQPR